MKLALLLFIAVAQNNWAGPTNRLEATSDGSGPTLLTQTNQGVALTQRIEKARAACIENRRQICGKILKVLPDGLVIDSGYTNLTREPLVRSWLVPGTAVASRAINSVEGNQPDSFCIGLVVITDLPKSPKVKTKPKLYDYVNIVAFPTGQYTYTSVGDIRRTVRRFSANFTKAVEWQLEQSQP